MGEPYLSANVQGTHWALTVEGYESRRVARCTVPTSL